MDQPVYNTVCNINKHVNTWPWNTLLPNSAQIYLPLGDHPCGDRKVAQLASMNSEFIALRTAVCVGGWLSHGTAPSSVGSRVSLVEGGSSFQRTVLGSSGWLSALLGITRVGIAGRDAFKLRNAEGFTGDPLRWSHGLRSDEGSRGLDRASGVDQRGDRDPGLRSGWRGVACGLSSGGVGVGI